MYDNIWKSWNSYYSPRVTGVKPPNRKAAEIMLNVLYVVQYCFLLLQIDLIPNSWPFYFLLYSPRVSVIVHCARGGLYGTVCRCVFHILHYRMIQYVCPVLRVLILNTPLFRGSLLWSSVLPSSNCMYSTVKSIVKLHAIFAILGVLYDVT